MASYLTLLEQLSTAVDQLNQVLQGDENTTVTINGQQQPSVQKKTLDEVNAKIQLVLDAAADIDAVKYTSTAAGIASGADFFSVVSDNDESYLDLYKNEEGIAKFEKSYPSSNFLTSFLSEDDTSHAISGFAVSEYVNNKFSAVIDPAKLILTNNDPALVLGYKVRESNGEIVPDNSWGMTDLISITRNTDYEVSGFLSPYGLAGYDSAGNFTENLDSGVDGTQTYVFQATHPNTTHIRVSTPEVSFGNFYLKKLEDTINKESLRAELEVPDVAQTVDELEQTSAPSSMAVSQYTSEKITNALTDVMDNARVLYAANDPAFVSGYKSHSITGVVAADPNWSMIDLFTVELGTYEASGYFENYGIAGYDKDGNFTESFKVATNGTQTYTFEITNPLTTQLRVSTFSTKLGDFYLKKIDSTLKINSLKKKLGVVGTLGTVYVAKDGDDGKSGAFNSPLQTINAALELVKNGGVVAVNAGDYYEALNFDLLVSGKIILTTFYTDKVRVMGSDILTNITKTAGRTNIYQAPFTHTLQPIGGVESYGYRIFEDGVPSQLIPQLERHALQRSQSYRLPYSEIKRIADQGSLSANLDYLDNLDAEESGFWVDGSNIYIVNAEHGDVSTSSIHYPVREGNFGALRNGTLDLEVRDIMFMYSSGNGLEPYGFGILRPWHVTILGSHNTGLMDSASHTEGHMIEAAGCGRDGIASALYFPLPDDGREKERWNKYSGIWCHDNYDDGFSTHQNGANDVENFLFEYNGDTNYQNVGTTYCTLRHGLSRKSTKGIVINGASVITHSRNSTTLDAYGVVSEDNHWNYDCISDENTRPAVMNLHDCVSRRATGFGYRSSGVNSFGTAYNCKSTDDAVSNDGFIAITDQDLS